MKRAFLQFGKLCASLRFLLAGTFFTGFINPGPENGFSPVWKTMCFFKIQLDMNFLSHDSQIRVLKMTFLQYGRLCASLRFNLRWTYCHRIYKFGSWKCLFFQYDEASGSWELCMILSASDNIYKFESWGGCSQVWQNIWSFMSLFDISMSSQISQETFIAHSDQATHGVSQMARHKRRLFQVWILQKTITQKMLHWRTCWNLHSTVSFIRLICT